MRFAFTPEQDQVRASAKALLAERMPMVAVRSRLDGEPAAADGLWQELAGLGWPGIYVDEEHGGQGLGIVELAILAEQLGYALTPLPVLPNAAAGLVVAELGSPEQRARWLGPIAAGELCATFGAADGEPPAALRGDRLSGTKLAVPDVLPGSLIVAEVQGRYAALHADAAGVNAAPANGLDPTRPVSAVEFDDADVALLGGGPAVRARAAIDSALAAECTGVAQRALDMAVAYSKERRQFGMQIGAFQAVAHRCAEMLRDVEGARSVAYGAAWACDASDAAGATLAAQIAKAHAVDAAVRVCESAIQIHGGIGFTWESDLHLLLRRAQANAQIWGTTADARAGIALSMGV
jgi:alkylation response protein AidB-like acyl-CoA dehydrogenase